MLILLGSSLYRGDVVQMAFSQDRLSHCVGLLLFFFLSQASDAVHLPNERMSRTVLARAVDAIAGGAHLMLVKSGRS